MWVMIRTIFFPIVFRSFSLHPDKPGNIVASGVDLKQMLVDYFLLHFLLVNSIFQSSNERTSQKQEPNEKKTFYFPSFVLSPFYLPSCNEVKQLLNILMKTLLVEAAEKQRSMSLFDIN